MGRKGKFADRLFRSGHFVQDAACVGVEHLTGLG